MCVCVCVCVCARVCVCVCVCARVCSVGRMAWRATWGGGRPSTSEVVGVGCVRLVNLFVLDLTEVIAAGQSGRGSTAREAHQSHNPTQCCSQASLRNRHPSPHSFPFSPLTSRNWRSRRSTAGMKGNFKLLPPLLDPPPPPRIWRCVCGCVCVLWSALIFIALQRRGGWERRVLGRRNFARPCSQTPSQPPASTTPSSAHPPTIPHTYLSTRAGRSRHRKRGQQEEERARLLLLPGHRGCGVLCAWVGKRRGGSPQGVAWG